MIFFSNDRARGTLFKYLAFDGLLVATSLCLSLFLRVGPQFFLSFLQQGLPLLPIAVLSHLTVFRLFGVYDIVWRYFSIEDAWLVVQSVFIAAAVLFGLNALLGPWMFPETVVLIHASVLMFLMLSSRTVRRYVHERPSQTQLRRSGRRVLIYGAGTTGRMLLSRLRTDLGIGYKPVGFIDDDPLKLEKTIAGLRVLGTGAELSQEIKATKAEEVIVAVQQPPAEILQRVMSQCVAMSVLPRIIKSEVSSAGPCFDLTRQIELSDLLGRTPKQVSRDGVRQLIEGKRVLITGAGGSIGSEIARQVHGMNPKDLILLDHSEYALYQIDRKLRVPTHKNSNVSPCLCDIQDKEQLENLYRSFRPQIVFHAAAYKHVHLSQINPYTTILNNVGGTRNLVELSEQYNVDRFVLISSDKAVRPAGIMGETKRVCEILVSESALRTGRRYTSVRFGNVLGSSGSLIPLLEEQIRNREVITVTHPDMTRYFMLIPEAVALVLNSVTLATPGDIMVLKMGDPVRIVDIASNLRSLMGSDEQQSPIVFTGLRPGEKLFEELCLSGNEVDTADPDILVIPDGDSALRDLHSTQLVRLLLDEILIAARSREELAVSLVHQVAHGLLTLTDSPSISVANTAPKGRLEIPHHAN